MALKISFSISRVFWLLRIVVPLLLFGSALSSPASSGDTEPHWIRVSSSHFSVLTDGGEKKGREIAVRLEQMRTVFAQLLMKTRVNMPEALDVIAFKIDKEYSQIAPIRDGQPISAPAFFLPSEDRNYIVLNLIEDDPWRSVTHEFAHLFIDHNYPPTQDWFDEGFAEYFSSLRLDNKQAQIGGDPEISVPRKQDLQRTQSESRSASKSLSELLSSTPWLAMSDLLTARHSRLNYQEGSHHTLFYAQSWIAIHYLLNKNKLSETGTYFDLMENQKVPVEQAIQQAYGMTSAQFDQALKDYFHSLGPSFQGQIAPSSSGIPNSAVLQFPLPVDNIGTSTLQVPLTDARTLIAEMMVRLSEHRQQALQELNTMIGQPKTENAIAHRALAWMHLQSKEYDAATEELSSALELDGEDPWVRYYLALVKYHAAESSGHPFQGLSNMMQDLRAVLDWNPEMAEAYSMLAMARVEGGGVNSAMESMRAAIQLSPRNEGYLLNMAQIYMAGKKWDAATALLERLKASPDPQIARAARKNLEDLPTLKKYGLMPQQTVTAAKSENSASAMAKPGALSKSGTTKEDSREEDEEAGTDQKPAASASPPAPDKRAIRFLKGKLVSVDCALAPAAVLTVAVGTKTMKLRAENYKSMLVIGADEFSCEWKNRPVSVNYKAGGKVDGDLVSLELQ
jgi:tetratricopeptide (TPR) repeat protein